MFLNGVTQKGLTPLCHHENRHPYPGACPHDYIWHELRDHQEYCKKIAMKTGTHTQVPVPMTS